MNHQCTVPWYNMRDPHLWGKWEDIKTGVLKFEGRVQGAVIIQERRCTNCNMVQLRAEGMP